MTATRPPIVGLYRLLQDFTSNEASIRIVRVASGGHSVEPHVHQRSKQFYVALEGRVVIEIDGVETELAPYDVIAVPRGSMHAARSAGNEAVVLNLSVPPLEPDDQVAVHPDIYRSDLALPRTDADLED